MLPWVLFVAALAAVAALAVKVRLLGSAMDGLARDLGEALSADTNTLISTPSRDRHVRALASALNRELRTLRDRRRLYEAGSARLRETVTNVSHDLRTPLTAISGFLELLEQEELPEDAARYIGIIRGRTRAMSELTGELFRWSLAESDGPGKPEDVSVRAMVEEAAAAFYLQLKARGIEPVITLPDDPVERALDRRALGRIFANLLSNAVKYSAGDLEIALTASGTVTFSNSAPGLTPVEAARLFDRCYTVPSSLPSTGLGLSIARTLAERLGAELTAELSQGRLTVTLKL